MDPVKWFLLHPQVDSLKLRNEDSRFYLIERLFEERKVFRHLQLDFVFFGPTYFVWLFDICKLFDMQFDVIFHYYGSF